MTKLFYIALLALPFFTSIEASIYKKKAPPPIPDAFIIRSMSDAGMFASMRTALAAYAMKEKYHMKEVMINLGTTGNYYEPELGENWWGYYFEPTISPLSYTKIREMTTEEIVEGLWLLRGMSRQENHALIKRYISIKQPILEKIEEFYQNNMQGSYLVGLHYRGTDKNLYEAARVDYEEVVQVLQKEIHERGLKNYKIFVATDEQHLLDTLCLTFSGKVVFTKAHRSKDAKSVHHSREDPYALGEEALIDAVLLAKCDLLIRTSSNLSLWSSHLNPDIPVIMLSHSANGYE